VGYATSRFERAAAPHLDPGEHIVDRRGGIESASLRLRNGATIDVEVAELGRTSVERFVACVNEQLVAARWPS
jgi:hypothetical protein